jgi:hypothetical protein
MTKKMSQVESNENGAPMLDHLKDKNRAWAARMVSIDADFLQASRKTTNARIFVDRLLG